MTYAVSHSLQAAVYQRLAVDAALTALVGSEIYDAAPSGAVPQLYVILGSEDVTARSDKTGEGAVHRFMVSVISNMPGFQAAKAAAGAVSDALQHAQLPLARGHLVYLRFEKAKAARSGDADQRRIDLRFVARVEDI